MILTVDGGIQESYAEALCLLFFPGAKFPKGEPETLDTVYVSIRSSFAGIKAKAFVAIESAGRRTEASAESEQPAGQTALLTEKIAVGKAFLKAGYDWNRTIPHWGILTGVRPAKVTSKFLEEGLTAAETAEKLSGVYLVSPEKAALASAVSEVEARLLTPQRRQACSVYIAIPFCPSRCSYCSFVSFTSPRLLSLLPAYLERLTEEIPRTFALIRELGLRVASVYIGGGTPTTLNEGQLAVLLGCIARETAGDPPEEFTLEAGRPDTITAEKLRIAARYGVTRVSVNPQTLNDAVLRQIGRRHTAEQFLSAYALATASGIRDINVDLIAGLETDTFESFRDSLDRVMALKPQNITVHTFSVKRASEVIRDNREIFRREATEAEKSVAYSQQVLLPAGYLPYYMYRQKNMIGNLENVGYAKAGHEGLYNVFMMEEVHSIFGIGASAVTKLMKPKQDGGVLMQRIFEPKYPYEYLNAEATDRESEKYRKISTFFDENETEENG